jgi:hypothetical protein
VTAAPSVSFFRPEFDDFLYAPIGADRNEMPLTVLSALSRLDIDPWKEAAELSELQKTLPRSGWLRWSRVCLADDGRRTRRQLLIV